MRRGAQAAVEKVLEFLEANKRSITTSEEISNVATISANGDRAVGQLIAQAMEKVGAEGVITVKEGKVGSPFDFRKSIKRAKCFSCT